MVFSSSVMIEIAQEEVKPESSSCMNSAMIEQSLVMVAPQLLFQPLNVAPVSARAVKVCSPTVRVAPSIVIVVPSSKVPLQVLKVSVPLLITPQEEAESERFEV